MKIARTLAAAATIIAITPMVAATAHAATPTPCEKMVPQVKAAAKNVKDADKTKFSDLQTKGMERCKADDDAGADAFFMDALKLAGK